MTLSGDFQDVSPVDVLQVISLTEQSGTLQLERGGQNVQLSFANGDLLTAQLFPQYRHLTSYFVKRGWVSFEMLHAALEHQSSGTPHQLIGQVLLELGALSEQQLIEGLQHHARVVLAEVLRWTTGTFRFIPQPSPPSGEYRPPQVGIALGRILLQTAVREANSSPPSKTLSLAPKHVGELARIVEEVVRPAAGRLLIVVTSDLLVLFGLELSLRDLPFSAVQLVEAADATQLLLASDDDHPILALDLDLMARLGRNSLRVFYTLRSLRKQWPNLRIISFGRDVPEAYYSFLQHGHVSFHLPRPASDAESSSAVIQDFVEALAKVITRAADQELG